MARNTSMEFPMFQSSAVVERIKQPSCGDGHEVPHIPGETESARERKPELAMLSLVLVVMLRVQSCSTGL